VQVSMQKSYLRVEKKMAGEENGFLLLLQLFPCGDQV